MPPRHAYWTILVDDQPTAFRAHDAEDLLATLNRLKEKHPTATMKWFERGKLWDSRDAAREAGFGQGERRWEGPRPERPSGDTRRDTRQGRADRDDRARPRDHAARDARSERPRDKNWRPGGEHRDPRQKYKDAKKAKWQRFKQNVRAGWESRPSEPERLRDDRPRDDRPRDDRPRSDVPRDVRPRDDRPRDDRPRPERPRDGRPRDNRRSDDRRPEQRWGSRGQSGQKPWSGRDQRGGDRPPRREGWKPKPPWSDRPRDSRDGGERDRHERRESRPGQRDRDWRPKGPPRGDRPPGSGTGGGWPKRRPEDREWRDRPRREHERPPSSTRPYDTDRPRGSKPFGAGRTKPFGRKPGGAKPQGARPKGKPFGPKRPRGPGRPPGRGPRKPRDDE